MKQIKAYRSDIGGGPAFLDGDVLAGCDGRTFASTSPRNDAMAAEWAEREARAILAETELGTHEVVALTGAEWVRAIAAESLAAFVALEIS